MVLFQMQSCYRARSSHAMLHEYFVLTRSALIVPLMLGTVRNSYTPPLLLVLLLLTYVVEAIAVLR